MLDVTNVSLTLGKILMVVSCRTNCISTLVLSFCNQFFLELVTLSRFVLFFGT